MNWATILSSMIAGGRRHEPPEVSACGAFTVT